MAEEHKANGGGSDQWVTDVLSKARTNSPSIPDAVWSRMGSLMKGEISERDLTAARVKALAAVLVGEMASASQEEDSQ